MDAKSIAEQNPRRCSFLLRPLGGAGMKRHEDFKMGNPTRLWSWPPCPNGHRALGPSLGLICRNESVGLSRLLDASALLLYG